MGCGQVNGQPIPCQPQFSGIDQPSSNTPQLNVPKPNAPNKISVNPNKVSLNKPTADKPIREKPDVDILHTKATKISSGSNGNNEAFNNGFMCQVAYKPDLAERFYIQAGNPESFNNIGSMKLAQKKYNEALTNYSKAIQQSIDQNPLFYINRGVTHTILNNFQLAQNDFKIVEQLLNGTVLPDNLSEDNIKFINSQISKYRQVMQRIENLTVQLTQQQEKKLNQFKVSFVSNMKSIFSEEDASKNISGNNNIQDYLNEVQKKKHEEYNRLVCELLQIEQSQHFSENCIEKVAQISYNLFKINHQNFEPVPFHFLVIFIKKFKTAESLQTLDQQIQKLVVLLTKKYPATADLPAQKKMLVQKQIQLKPTILIQEVNLFKNKFFTNHKALLKEISDIHNRSEKQLESFKQLAQGPCSRYGEKFKYNCKMPSIQKKVDYFKVFIRICEKILKNNFSKQEILKKVFKKIQTKQINIFSLIETYFDVWTQELDIVLAEKKKKRQELHCNVYDFIRGKCQFKSLSAINKAANEIITDCQSLNYGIIQIDNRLAKNTQDLVFKIKIRQAVAQLQLALSFDSELNQYNHCLYEIKRSPLGSIFGSLLWLGKINELKFLNRINKQQLAKISFDQKKYQKSLTNAIKAYEQMKK